MNCISAHISSHINWGEFNWTKTVTMTPRPAIPTEILEIILSCAHDCQIRREKKKKPPPQNAAPSPWRWLEVRRVSRRTVASLAESHTWLASSEERRSLAKISNLAMVAFTKVSIWLEERSCLCVRMCVCVCMPQTLGGLTVQARACPGQRHKACQKWKMMAARRPRGRGGHSPVHFFMSANTHPTCENKRLRYTIRPRSSALISVTESEL